MVIWFNNDKARRHLLENGFVFTARPPSKRKGRLGVRKLGNEPLFWKEYKKKGIVHVSLVGKALNEMALRPYVGYSGFESLAEWVGQGIEFPAFLYRVSLISLYSDFRGGDEGNEG